MTILANLPADQYHADAVADTPTLSASIAHKVYGNAQVYEGHRAV
jgi:hypothetical protein